MRQVKAFMSTKRAGLRRLKIQSDTYDPYARIRARMAQTEASRILAHVEPSTPSYDYGYGNARSLSPTADGALAESLAAFCQMEGF